MSFIRWVIPWMTFFFFLILRMPWMTWYNCCILLSLLHCMWFYLPLKDWKLLQRYTMAFAPGLNVYIHEPFITSIKLFQHCRSVHILKKKKNAIRVFIARSRWYIRSLTVNCSLCTNSHLHKLITIALLLKLRNFEQPK